METLRGAGSMMSGAVLQPEPVLRSVAGAVYHSGPDRAGGGMESVCVSAESGEWY